MASNRSTHLLATYLKPQWPQAALLTALLLGSIGLQLLNPQILRRFIDAALAGSPVDQLTGLALLFLGVALASQIISVMETYLAENLALTATNQLRADLTLHCLQLDLPFHQSHPPGELIERVDGDVATLGNLFSRFVVYLLGNAILLVGVLIFLFRIDGRVGLVLTLFAGLVLGLLTGLRNVAVPRWTAARQASAELFGFLEERLSGAEDIRANGGTAYVLLRLHERSRNLLYRQRAASLAGSAMGSITVLAGTLNTAIALGLGAYLYTQGAMTLGTVYLIFSYTALLNQPIEQFSRQLQDLQQAAASLGRIQKLRETMPAIWDGPGSSLPPGALSVEFQRVSFGYPDAEPILHDLSFLIQPGKVLGLLGRTGSGKTSLIRLLFRLYDPTTGTIRIGGIDLRTLKLAALRQRVGMVTQDIQLFHASVRDNLAFFDRSIPDDRILEAIRELGLWTWYQTLPHGLNTRLAPGGSGLSAGEAQLLAFARVFLKNPGLVILDEASSRLDPATERRVEQAVDRLLAGRTGIIIAHRLATVQRADEILILENGHVREYGPRQFLASNPDSQFAHLLRVGLEEALA